MVSSRSNARTTTTVMMMMMMTIIITVRGARTKINLFHIIYGPVDKIVRRYGTREKDSDAQYEEGCYRRSAREMYPEGRFRSPLETNFVAPAGHGIFAYFMQIKRVIIGRGYLNGSQDLVAFFG